ncbi:MAG: MarR family transcriptional regulator [Dehalococcoidales bacterium]|jgi:DNA-binding MarR family transcriptional regulator
MDKTREDLLQTLIQRLMSVMRHARHGSPPPEPILKLTPPQLHLLFSISMKKEGVSAKELAERSSVTPGAVTQFVDMLVEKGLVAREGDSSDRRIVRLKLTDLAQSQLEQFKKDQVASMSRVFEPLSNRELKVLVALFSKMDVYHEMKEKAHAETHQTP